MFAAGAGAADPNDFAPSPGARWHEDFCAKGTETVLVGDFNKDRCDDIVAFDGDRVLVLFGVGARNRFDGPLDWSYHPLPAGATAAAGDVDGDGYGDLVYFANDGVYGIFTDSHGFTTKVKAVRFREMQPETSFPWEMRTSTERLTLSSSKRAAMAASMLVFRGAVSPSHIWPSGQALASWAPGNYRAWGTSTATWGRT